MKKSAYVLITLVLTLSLLVPSAYAANFWDFMSNMSNNATSISNNIVDEAANTSSDMMGLMSKLSDDIGSMADRIGEMADRIVATEELMADVATQMQSGGCSDSGSSASTALLLTPYGTHVWPGDVPNIYIENQTEQYLLYAGASPQLSNDSVAFLVRDNDSLAEAWSYLSELAENGKIFIAVKTIDGNSISSLSNATLITLNL